MPAVAQVRAESLNFDIPAQPINEALLSFARQAGVRFVMADAQFGNTRSNALRGTYDRDSALAELLRGTGVAARLENGAIVLQRSADASGAARPGASPTPVNLAQIDDADRVVVVGTNIRGVDPTSSPIEIYTSQDVARTGATTTEQFVQKLPQNFGSRNQYALGAINQGFTGNNESVNSIDLRGLGVGTTLTLLNGRRLALANNNQAVDVSHIPLGAVERVEVLTDGASAIYGSDAIGGVVNFVLRDDFEGAETRVSYGGVTSGGLRQGEISQTLGADWSSGHGLVTVGASSFSALKTTDRDYAGATGPGTLTPIDQRYSALASASQDVGDRIELNADLSYSTRSVKNTGTVPGAAPQFERYDSNTEQYFGNFGANIEVTPDLEASFLASYSSVDVDSTTFLRIPAFSVNQSAPFDSEHKGYDLTAQLSGKAFELPAGSVQFSLGAGYVDEEAKGVRGSVGAANAAIGRTTTYAFGEVLVPLVGQAQAIPFVKRLELSLAARYTNYENENPTVLSSELGSDTVPKVGVLWSPFDGLNLRGTYGESFRAPSLAELDPTLSLFTLRRSTVAGALTPVLLVQGTTPYLVPETSESYTFGFDYRPAARPTASLSATYFNIDYANHIQHGSIFAGAALALPASFPDFIYRPSSPAQIEDIIRRYRNTANTLGINLSDPATAANTLFTLPGLWILDGRYRNLLASELDGIDISFSDSFDAEGASIHYGANITRTFAYRQRSSANSPNLNGVDVVGRPSDLRGRIFAGASSGPWETTVSANYVDDYDNPYAPGGSQPVDEWLTFDLVGRYNFQSMTIGLSFQNFFNAEPPRVRQSSSPGLGLRDTVGFDPSNANPLGRLIVLSLTKRW